MALTNLSNATDNATSSSAPSDAGTNSKKSNKSGAAYRRRQKEKKLGLAPGSLDNVTARTGLSFEESLNLSPEADPTADPDLPAAESVSVESHGEDERGGFRGILARASNAIRNDDSPRTQRQTKTSKAASQQEFNTLVVSVLTLLVTFAKVDNRVKPNGDEIGLLSEHLTGILLRHFPINNKLSADALDIIGIMAVTASWYSRVHADIEAARAPDREQLRQPAAASQQPARKNGHVPTDPIESASPETFAWLNGVAAKSEGV